MNILIIGSGGREHAFAWKIKQSTRCSRLYVAPGNAGTATIAENVNIEATDFTALGEFVIDKNIELVVVGPEDPLVKGIRNYFESHPQLKAIALIGPGKEGAELEGSKNFAKEFMVKYNIPTAKSRTFYEGQVPEGLVYIENHALPVVLKADGLAAGKGVIIATSKEEAKATLKAMLDGKMFGDASSKVVIEEFLEGIELSVFVLTDGHTYKILPEAKDYKRIGEGDTGLNTGGMGAISPVPFAGKQFIDKVERQVIIPTINGLKQSNIDYKGFIFIGLMNVKGEPYVIEYNVRMGDPETEAVLPRIKSDFVELLWAASQQRLGETEIKIDERTATTVVLVSGGYPGSYEKGKIIEGLEGDKKGLVFHAGTKSDQGRVLTNGGRVLALTALGNSIEEGLESVYQTAEEISWEGCYYRKDIGQDLIRFSNT